MSDQRDGGIQWTDETWNPLRGCSRVSEGCRHCYAEKVAARFCGPGQPYEGLVRLSAEGKHGRARWNGTVRFVPEKLDEPLRWKRPRRVFVNSMSDLFHESVPFEQIAAIFGVMAACPQHTFQVLTKRPGRMRAWFEWLGGTSGAGWSAVVLGHAARELGPDIDVDALEDVPFPLPNVWLGVSVEDQKTADERVPLLLATPAAVRWVSYEPAIGPVDFDAWLFETHVAPVRGALGIDFAAKTIRPAIDWIVVGGESGPGARPFDLAWARSVIEQTRDTGCRVFVKQLGAKPTDGWSSTEVAKRRVVRLDDRKGGNLSEWPDDLRVREWPTQEVR